MRPLLHHPAMPAGLPAASGRRRRQRQNKPRATDSAEYEAHTAPREPDGAGWWTPREMQADAGRGRTRTRRIRDAEVAVLQGSPEAASVARATFMRSKRSARSMRSIFLRCQESGRRGLLGSVGQSDLHGGRGQTRCAFTTCRMPTPWATREAGYGGERNVTTWRQRLAVLRDLGFVDCKDGPAGPYQYCCSSTPAR